MANASTLSERIKAEFESRDQRMKAADQQRAKEAGEREKRLAQFTAVCDDLRAVWGPRLEEFARQFGDKIRVTPTVTPSNRQARASFLTDLANITLTLTASAGSSVTTLVLDYDLLIIPMLFEYERSARLEMPLDRVDKAAVGKWIDDRLVSCVRAYLSLKDNELYVKHAMVEDPISKTRLLKEDAAAKFDHNGRTYYFSSDDTLRQYKQKHQITT